ncbi:hypothetical protein E2562_010090 [Oryza meyeriana var. granulata]|uniref:Uncharacterized protein n=1 Tax=Oryza meyeriana var. granulata TaxID=110450 RepID=A0A6G1EKD9_9ORYZ|nr:hypothetical protein E2562_010090 [Oryza meyeriana var. granulata]
MGDANGNQAQHGLPPRHRIIPDAVAAAARASRPVLLASQAQLLGGGGVAAAGQQIGLAIASQQPPAQTAIPAQMRRSSRNPWSRTVPSLLSDGKSYHIIDPTFGSEQELAPVPAQPPSPRPISAAFAWPVPPRGWTVSPTTGRYRFGASAGASSSSAAPRAPTPPPPPAAAAAPRAPAPAPPAPPAAPPGLPPTGAPVVRPPRGPARARLAPVAPEEAFEEYLMEHRVIDAPVDAVPWQVIGGSEYAGIFVVGGPARNRAELEAAEARERRKNRMDKRKAVAAARAQQSPPPTPADAPESSGGSKKKRGGGRKKKQA